MLCLQRMNFKSSDNLALNINKPKLECNPFGIWGEMHFFISENLKLVSLLHSLKTLT